MVARWITHTSPLERPSIAPFDLGNTLVPNRSIYRERYFVIVYRADRSKL
jgi:hypothetical protein